MVLFLSSSVYPSSMFMLLSYLSLYSSSSASATSSPRSIDKLSLLLVTPFLSDLTIPIDPRNLRSLDPTNLTIPSNRHPSSHHHPSSYPSLRYSNIQLPFQVLDKPSTHSASSHSFSLSIIVTSKVLYSFILIRIGSTATMVLIKVVHSASIIVANFIDRYLLGILAVSMN